MEFARVLEMVLVKIIRGVFNCGGGGTRSKYEFALMVARCGGWDECLIIPASIDGSDFLAPRGKNLSMDSRGLEKVLGIKSRDKLQSIRMFFQDQGLWNNAAKTISAN